MRIERWPCGAGAGSMRLRARCDEGCFEGPVWLMREGMAAEERTSKKGGPTMTDEYANHDPFHTETELLKQIGLFQRKAAKLDDATSHGRMMHELYSAIVIECREELNNLDMESESWLV